MNTTTRLWLFSGNLVHGRYPTVTTTTVIVGAHALILSAVGRTIARQFLRDIEESSSRIV
jgi:regulator of extracellular matrix RemA (YlzA/DUF370 family)